MDEQQPRAVRASARSSSSPLSSGVTAGTGTPAPGGGAPPGASRVISTGPGAGLTTNLHLGCGTNRLQAWCNVDGDPACSPDLVVDLRSPWPFDDASVDFIYSEHLLEHFPLDTALSVLDEAHRVLKSGGVIRTAMPDLRTVVDAYLGDWRGDWLKDYPEIDSRARMLNAALRYWGHEYLWDREELHLRLAQAGFVRIATAPWGRSTHPTLCGLETRAESDLIVEAQKDDRAALR